MAEPVDHEEILELVREIDNSEDAELSKREINIIARFIDGRQRHFTEHEADTVRDIYQRRIENPVEEEEDDE